MAGEGIKAIQDLRDGGFSDQEVLDYQKEQTQTLQSGGFSQQEIDDYWGSKPYEGKIVKGVVSDNLQAGWDPRKLKQDDPNSWFDAWVTGMEHSAPRLAAGIKPEFSIPPENAPFMNKVMFGIGQGIGDYSMGLPVMLGAARAGQPILGAYAMGAMPEAIRQARYAEWAQGEDATWSDVGSATWNVIVNANTAGLTNLIAGKAGEIARKSVQPFAGNVVTHGTEIAAVAGAAGITPALLQGRLPTGEDLGMALVLSGALPLGLAGSRTLYSLVGATKRVQPTPYGEKVMDNMMNIWAETGIPPKDQAQAAVNDPYMRQSLYGHDPDNQPMRKVWKTIEGTAEKSPKEEHMPAEAEIVGGMEKQEPKITPMAEAADAEPVPFKYDAAAKVSEETGIPPVNSVTPDQMLDLVSDVEATANVAKARGERVENVVSDVGAIGEMQVMPDTARQYGFDPTRLTDPEYNRKVAGTILADLSKRFRNPDGTVDLEAVLIAYNAGPGKAKVFRAAGRDYDTLPPETRNYLVKAGRLLEGGRQLERVGGGGKKPPTPPGYGKSEGGLPDRPRKGPGGKGEEPFDRDFETMTEVVREGIDHGDGETRTLGDWRRKATYEFWSELHPANRFDRLVNRDEGDMGAADAMRNVYGAQGRAFHRIWHGGLRQAFDPMGRPMHKKNDVPAYAEAMKLAAKEKEGIDGFEALLQARRSRELAKQGKDSILSLKDAEATIKAAGDKYKEAISIRRRANTSRILGNVEADTLSKEAADATLRQNPDWFAQIPAEHAANVERYRRFGLGKIMKRAEGHENKVRSGILADTARFYRDEHINSVNMARRYIADLIEQHFNPKSGKMEPGKSSMGLFVNRILASGHPRLKYHEREMDLYDPDGNLIEKAADTFEKAPDAGEINFYDKGRLVSYKVPKFDGSEEMVHMLMNLNSIDPGIATGFAMSFATNLRAAIATPVFTVKMALIDAQGSAIMSKYGGVPFANIIKGAYNAIDYGLGGKLGGYGDQLFQEYIANNGFGADITRLSSNRVIEDWHKLEAVGFYDRALNVAKHPLEAYQRMLRLGDTLARVSVYDKARQKLGPLKAGIEARKATGDFAERTGNQIMNTLISMDAYYAPWQRSLDVVGRAIPPLTGKVTRLSDWKTSGRTMAKAVAAITMPTLLFYAYNEAFENLYEVPENQRVRNLPDYERDSYFQLWMPGPNGPVLTHLRGPYELYPIFGGLMVNRTLDWARGNRPELFDGFMGSLMHAFGPPGTGKSGLSAAISVVPFTGTMIRPLIENYTNYSMSLDRPLVPETMKDAYGYEQFYPNTTETAKNLAYYLGPHELDWANISPLVIENYAKAWTGPILTGVTGVFEGFVVDKKQTFGGAAELPVGGSFFVRRPGFSAKPIEDFYGLYDDYNMARTSLRLAIKRGDMTDMQLLASDEKLAVKMDQMYAAFSVMRQTLEYINNDKTMTPVEKSQFADQTFDQAIFMARGMNEVITTSRDALKAARK